MDFEKPVLIFSFQNVMGGVPSFYRNIINHTSLKDEVSIKVILLHCAEDNRARFTDTLLVEEIQHFQYSSFENHYHIAKRLCAAFGNKSARIITDNMLTLNAANLFRNQKAIIYLVHDYFYVGYALQCRNVIDTAIAHSSFFRDILLAASIRDFRDKAVYLPYGVELPPRAWQKRRDDKKLRLVFLGRLSESKGTLLLKEIDNHLQRAELPVEWTIVGKGPLLGQLHEQWSGIEYVTFIAAENTEEVYKILENNDVLVFPTWFEGTPVAIMEAMSRGVVPVVSDLPGGIRDMVTADVGYRCDTMNAGSYAEAIIELYSNPARMHEMQDKCLTRVIQCYDIYKAADSYFRKFLSVALKSFNGTTPALFNMSRLDKAIFPNWAVYAFRKLMSQIKNV